MTMHKALYPRNHKEQTMNKENKEEENSPEFKIASTYR